jgi:IclR family pca regulon transcriptional regulator
MRETADCKFLTLLARGRSVIRAFGPERSEMTVAAAGTATHTTPAAVRQFLLMTAQLCNAAVTGERVSLAP